MKTKTTTKTFRLPAEIATEAEKKSIEAGVSLNSWVAAALEDSIARDFKGDGKSRARKYVQARTVDEGESFLRVSGERIEATAPGGVPIPDAGSAFSSMSGPATNKLAMTDVERFRAERVDFDAQLCLYSPEEPDVPFLALLGGHFDANRYYIRLSKANSGGQWARRKRISVKFPESIRA